MSKALIIGKLKKFRMVDKYRTFYTIQPQALFAGDDQHDMVTELLDDCARRLVKLFEATPKKPPKTSLKKVCIECMVLIMNAPVNTENKEFAYELCWYLSEIVQVDLLKTSAGRKWGFRKPQYALK